MSQSEATVRSKEAELRSQAAELRAQAAELREVQESYCIVLHFIKRLSIVILCTALNRCTALKGEEKIEVPREGLPGSAVPAGKEDYRGKWTGKLGIILVMVNWASP